MSDTNSFARLSTNRTAEIGPVPLTQGGDVGKALRNQVDNRAAPIRRQHFVHQRTRGRTVINSRMCPALTVPIFLNTDFNAASYSDAASGFRDSSVSNVVTPFRVFT